MQSIEATTENRHYVEAQPNRTCLGRFGEILFHWNSFTAQDKPMFKSNLDLNMWFLLSYTYFYALYYKESSPVLSDEKISIFQRTKWIPVKQMKVTYQWRNSPLVCGGSKEKQITIQVIQITTLAWKHVYGLLTTSEQVVCGMFWSCTAKGSIWTCGESREYFWV